MLMTYWESESEKISGPRRNIFIVMRGEKEKLKSEFKNEVWGKERLFDSLFSFEVDRTMLQQTELQATDTTRLDHIQDAEDKN